MKKLMMIGLVLAMALNMSLSVFAATGAFASSPSGQQAPVLVEAENESDDCVAQLLITAYGDRDEMSEKSRLQIEEAYAVILGTQDLSVLNEGVSEIVQDLKIETTDLAVSHLFDISASECNGHADHGHFEIKLEVDTLRNFVCLLHYYNGEWRIVENAEVTEDGSCLVFDEKEFSPFAIVVYTGEEPLEPDSNLWWLVIVIIGSVAVAGGATYATVRYKKKMN